MTSRWIQANCSVFEGPDGLPHMPWSLIARATSEWREGDLFARWFFVRKPPGLRLRFAGPRLDEFEATLSTWLTDQETRNHLRGFRFGVYEPEQHRFGGASGLSLAHELFDADADLAVAYEAAASKGQPVPDRMLVSVALTTLLLRSAVDDRAEAWDVWKRLETLLNEARGRPGSGPAAPSVGRAVDGSILDDLPVGCTAPLERFSTVAARVGHELTTVTDSGRLEVGPRAWLAAAATFHWNRWGLPLDIASLDATVGAVAARLAPDGEGRQRVDGG